MNMVIREISKRFIFLLLGVVSGFILSFVLTFIWLLVKGYMLGYGDSGPGWVNKVTDMIQLLSVLIGVVSAQLLLNRINKRGLF